MSGLYRRGTLLLSAVMVALGLVLIVQGIATGRPVGLLLGGLFVVAGGGRLYLLRRR